jgi:hypothetical protein
MRSDGDNKASFQVVNLNASTISGHIFMQGASFGGELSADFCSSVALSKCDPTVGI